LQLVLLQNKFKIKSTLRTKKYEISIGSKGDYIMPIDDPYKRKIARHHLLMKTVCRKCGALNPIKAKKCRRCRSKDLRLKKRELQK